MDKNIWTPTSFTDKNIQTPTPTSLTDKNIHNSQKSLADKNIRNSHSLTDKNIQNHDVPSTLVLCL